MGGIDEMTKKNRLNYAALLRYIKEYEQIKYADIADALDIDSGLLSRIVNNKVNMQKKDISSDKVYSNLFKRIKEESTKQYIFDLNTFLNENGYTDTNTSNAYSKYLDSSHDKAAAKAYFISILDHTSYAKNAEECKEPESSLSQSELPQIKFAQFTNPIHDSKCVFFGREEMMCNIHDMLSQYGICIIHGIGGLGKTYCSLKYAEKHSTHYSQVQQVVFSSSIKSTLLKISFDGLDETGLSEEEKLARRFSLLESFNDDTLLIVDNMDTIPEDKDNYERLKNCAMHIIITSRQATIDASKYMLQIGELSPDEQFKLFQHFCEFDIDEKDYADFFKLFKVVEGHTLLIELIAKTMSASDLTPDEMIDILHSATDNEIDSVEILKDDHYQQEKLNNFISKLFDTSDLSEAQKNILMNLSIASVTGIKRKLFRVFTKCNLSDINRLIDQSWIIKNHSGSGPSSAKIHLHPVIRSAVISNTDPTLKKCISYVQNVTDYLKNEYDNISLLDKSDLCDILINSGNMFSFEDSNAELLYDIGEVLWKQMQYKEAYEFYIKGITVLKNTDSKQTDLLIALYLAAGKTSVRLADYKKAIKQYETAQSIIETSNDQNRFAVLAEIYDEIGMVLRKDSKYKQALDYLTKAQNIIDVENISDPRLKASVYNHKGVVYLNLNIYDRAKENYQAGLEIRETIKDKTQEDKENLAYSYHNIGTVYQRTQKYSDALHWHQKALELRQEIFPENHPIVAASLTMIGNDYVAAAKNDNHFNASNALDYFTKGIQIRETVLGKQHPDMAWSYQSIGDWYYYQKEYKTALTYYKNCLNIRRQALSNNHSYTAIALVKLGETYIQLGNYDLAKSTLEEALLIQKEQNLTRAQKETEQLLSSISQA